MNYWGSEIEVIIFKWLNSPKKNILVVWHSQSIENKRKRDLLENLKGITISGLFIPDRIAGSGTSLSAIPWCCVWKRNMRGDAIWKWCATYSFLNYKWDCKWWQITAKVWAQISQQNPFPLILWVLCDTRDFLLCVFKCDSALKSMKMEVKCSNPDWLTCIWYLMLVTHQAYRAKSNKCVLCIWATKLQSPILLP